MKSRYCHDECHLFNGYTRPSGIHTYASGRRYCKTCIMSYKTTARHCKCCGRRLRLRPTWVRKPGPKARM